MSYERFTGEESQSSASSEISAAQTPFPLEEMANRNSQRPAHATSRSVDMDFLASITPPVVSQPQTFMGANLDPTSRNTMAGLPSTHMTGTTLQYTLKQTADQLQRSVQGEFVSLKGNMSYKDLLAGLIHKDETFEALNSFKFMKYINLQFCDDTGTILSQRSGGICLVTSRRILFLSSQVTVGTSLSPWGDPKQLPGGYSITSSCNDTTYYQPIPLRCLRSVEISGEAGVRAEAKFHGVEPSCYGWCGLCGDWCPDSGALKRWRPLPISRSQVQEMRVTVGLLMPPWDRKMFLKIFVHPKVPLPVTRDFVALLQKNSPGLC